MMWYCKTCGCNDVEGQHWVNLNTDQISDVIDWEKYWCNVCDDYCQVTEDPNEWKEWEEINKGEEKFESNRENDKV